MAVRPGATPAWGTRAVRSASCPRRESPMRLTRRRSDRPDPARRGWASRLEVLEGRQLLSSFDSRPHPFSVYLPTDLAVQNPITHQPEPLTYQRLVHDENPQSPLLNNQGKVVSGKDR